MTSYNKIARVNFYKFCLSCKSVIENSIGSVEFDFHNSKLGLLVWLAKQASLFGYHSNYCSYPEKLARYFSGC